MADSPKTDVTASIDEMIQDAREVYERLVIDEDFANQLLCKAHLLNSSAATMKEYQEIIEKLDETSNERCQSNLVSTIPSESNQLHQLQNENKQLKVALEDHQFALELVMSKYRQQACQLFNYHRSLRVPPVSVDFESHKIIDILSTRINNMAQVMLDSITVDEEAERKKEEILSQLQLENETLRELIKIAVRFRSLRLEDIPNGIL